MRAGGAAQQDYSVAPVSPTPRPSAHQPCPVLRPIASEQIQASPLLRQIVLMLRNHFKMLLFLFLIIGLPLHNLKKLFFTERNTFLLFWRHQFLLILGEVFRCQDTLEELECLDQFFRGRRRWRFRSWRAPNPRFRRTSRRHDLRFTSRGRHVSGSRWRFSTKWPNCNIPFPIPFLLPFRMDRHIFPCRTTLVAPFTHWPSNPARNIVNTSTAQARVKTDKGVFPPETAPEIELRYQRSAIPDKLSDNSWHTTLEELVVLNTVGRKKTTQAAEKYALSTT